MTLMILPGLAGAVAILMLYFRNNAMRKFLALEIKDFLANVMDKFR